MQVHTCTIIEYKHTHRQVYVLADRQTDRYACSATHLSVHSFNDTSTMGCPGRSFGSCIAATL